MLIARSLVLLGSGLVSLSIASMAHADVTTANSITGSVSDGTTSIPYRLFEPTTPTTPGTKLPLVLYLHGMGERGTDNVTQTTWMGNLLNHTSSGQYSAYVLAPQISTSMWLPAYGNQAESEAESLVMSALKQAESNPNIDTSRIYITGVSMGSFGTWDLLRRNPTTFAAAVPISGGGDPTTASIVKNIPIWAFHGSADNVVGVQSTRDMINALKAVGGNPNYTEVAGAGHADLFPQVYADASNTLYPWLFSQQLPGASTSTADTLTTTSDAATNGSAVLAATTGSIAAFNAAALPADPTLTDPTLVDAAAGSVSVPEPIGLSLLTIAGVTLLKRRRKWVAADAETPVVFVTDATTAS